MDGPQPLLRYRPRCGDFLYSELELKVMESDILSLTGQFRFQASVYFRMPSKKILGG
jgi:hypothetical protein